MSYKISTTSVASAANESSGAGLWWGQKTIFATNGPNTLASGSIVGWLLIILLSVFTSTVLDRDRDQGNPSLVLDYKSTISGNLQAYYDAGPGFQESDSSIIFTTASNEFQQVRLPLVYGILKALRLDPPDRKLDTTLSIKNIRIEQSGKPDILLSPQSIIPVQNIESIQLIDETNIIRVGPGADPILEIKLEEPLKLTQESNYIPDATVFLKWFVVWTAAVLLIWRLSIALTRLSVSGLLKINAIVVILAGSIGTLIACSPVIFLGKSLVSPNTGPVVLFYENCPTIPSVVDCEVEDTNSADVGAMAWQHFPYVVAQQRSIQKDREFPLWNRYNSSGISMIGQGQAMIGDPLTWIQWIVGADAWSFDVKFIFLRIVFAVSIGLSVLLLTNSASASALTAFTMPFIGYFIYRLDHPAVFTICYAPLILLCWLNLSLTKNPRRWLVWLFGLMVANWLVLNSGTVKEAYMAILVLNAGGAGYYFAENRGKRFGWYEAMLGISGISFSAISLPIYGIFLHNLQNAKTNYDKAEVQQLKFGEFIKFVDSYINFSLTGTYFVSVNAVLIVGLLASLIYMRNMGDISARRAAISLGITAAVCLVLAFGMIPSSIIIAIPFVRNIVHIHNTFGSVMIVPTSILAGIGFSIISDRIKNNSSNKVILNITLAFALLCASFFLAAPLSDALKTTLYVIVLASGSILLVWIALSVSTREITFSGSAIAITAMIVALGRGAALLPMSSHQIDSIIFEPGTRASLISVPRIATNVLEKTQKEPSRVFGTQNVLFQGYNTALGLENIGGPDAVMVRRYRELVEAFDLPSDWFWRIKSDAKTIIDNDKLFDLLGVRYVFSEYPLGNFQAVDSDGRVSLYERPNAWPRAFFTNKIEVVDDLAMLVSRIQQGDSKPFVAVAKPDRFPQILNLLDQTKLAEPPIIVAATDYNLTTNTTSFTVKAPTQGVVYLGEVNTDGDFDVLVNGQKFNTFMANYTFKGIFLPEGGTYRVKVAYWPKNLTEYLAVAVGGLVVWLLLFTAFWISNRPRTTS